MEDEPIYMQKNLTIKHCMPFLDAYTNGYMILLQGDLLVKKNENNEHVRVINTLRNQLNDLSLVKSEYESVKHQLQHVDTFRNELSKSREELESVHGKYGSEIEALKKEHENAIKELNDQIDYLKLTPAKRKKIDEAKAAQVTVDGADLEELIISDEILKDGGSF